jgi:hypothetical protein
VTLPASSAAYPAAADARTCDAAAGRNPAWQWSDYDTKRAYIEIADEMTRLAADRAAERPFLRVVPKG